MVKDLKKQEIAFKDLLTPANLLSLSRIPIVFIMIIFYQNKALFLVLLTIAIVTDLLDGYVARVTRPTALGAFIDPLCDKIFFTVLLIFLVLVSGLAMWQLLILLLRDIFMLLMIAVFFFHPKKQVISQNIKARSLGKLTTAGQFVALLWLILEFDRFDYVLFAVAIVSMIAVFDYALFVQKEIDR